MRFLKEQSPPKGLSDFLSKGGNDYKNLPKKPKKDIEKALISEQQGLCAYCMKRISTKPVPNVGDPQIIIEHFLPRNGEYARPDLQLTYSNMLGVCRGNKDSKSLPERCDQSKKDKILKFVDIRNPEIESQIQFLQNGEIDVVSENEDLKDDLELLNLNERFLVANRKRILVKLREDYSKVKKEADKTKVINFLEKELSRWNKKEGDLPEFNLVAIKFLKPKLERLKSKK